MTTYDGIALKKKRALLRATIIHEINCPAQRVAFMYRSESGHSGSPCRFSGVVRTQQGTNPIFA